MGIITLALLFSGNCKEPLIKYMVLLRDLKRAVARREMQLMALVLNKFCNAANVRFRPRPVGLTGLSVLGVMNY